MLRAHDAGVDAHRHRRHPLAGNAALRQVIPHAIGLYEDVIGDAQHHSVEQEGPDLPADQREQIAGETRAQAAFPRQCELPVRHRVGHPVKERQAPRARDCPTDERNQRHVSHLQRVVLAAPQPEHRGQRVRKERQVLAQRTVGGTTEQSAPA